MLGDLGAARSQERLVAIDLQKRGFYGDRLRLKDWQPVLLDQGRQVLRPEVRHFKRPIASLEP